VTAKMKRAMAMMKSARFIFISSETSSACALPVTLEMMPATQPSAVGEVDGSEQAGGQEGDG
jgi:hypothetical protein